MKKIFRKSNIFSFLLGAVIFGGIVGVSAYTIFANDIGYTPKDSTWKVSNVSDAIDDLKNSCGQMTLIENNCSGRYEKTISVANIEGYENLTADNFVIVLTGINGDKVNDGEDVVSIAKTYNAETGTLTISKCKFFWGVGRTAWPIYSVYLLR